MAKIDFGGVVEEVVTRDEFPLEKARAALKDEVVAVLGYGVQGPAQALNERSVKIVFLLQAHKTPHRRAGIHYHFIAIHNLDFELPINGQNGGVIG